jgi:hypothetical protein
LDLSLPIEDIIDNKIYPDMTKDRKCFYQLKEKAKLIAQQTKCWQLRRARWLRQSEGVTYKNRQAFFKIEHANREAKKLEATLPHRQAKEELKQKNREWKGKAEEISAVFCKRTKLLQREKKQVTKILEEQFPETETGGETKDTHVTQISHLKYAPLVLQEFTLSEKQKHHK